MDSREIPPIQSAGFFAIPVFSAVLPNFPQHAPALRELVLARANGEAGVRASNQHAFHSARDFHRVDHPSVGWLTESVLDVAKRAIGPLARRASAELSISGCWATAIGRAGWLTPHHHFPSPWAGLLYVDAEAAAANEDPNDRAGKLELLNPVPLAEVYGLPSGVTIAPKDGLLVLFPGALQHLVHPNRTDHLRISISFNLELR